jgi:hypothetical protein
MSCQCFMWLGHIFCRKGIRVLDPKKLPVMDVIDFAAMSDTNDLPLAAASPATGQTKSRSTSFKNELTQRRSSKYRDPDNSEVLMGELMPLGKAFGILAICMFGHNLPTEKHRHVDRLQVWKNAAKYALTMNSIKVVLEWRDQKAFVIYMQGLLTTALVCIRKDLPNSASLLASKPSSLGSEPRKRSCTLALARLSPSWSSKYLRSVCI